MSRGARVLSVVVAAGWLGAVASAARPDGAGAYVRYCASCHGVAGRGDGPAAPALTPRPTDLTQLTRRNGGVFPFYATVRSIDGRDVVRAHGSSAMPVWGERFDPQPSWSLYDAGEVRYLTYLLAAYVESLQRD